MQVKIFGHLKQFYFFLFILCEKCPIRFGVTKYEEKKLQDSKQFDLLAPSLFRSLLFGVSLQFPSLCLCVSLRVPLFGGMSPQGP